MHVHTCAQADRITQTISQEPSSLVSTSELMKREGLRKNKGTVKAYQVHNHKAYIVSFQYERVKTNQ